jgi:hypothetical protein
MSPERVGSLSSEELELVAAYLDDRLPPEGRSEAERLFANSAEAREVLATVASLDDAEEGVPLLGRGVGGIRRWLPLIPVAAAAMIALLLLNGDSERQTRQMATRVAAANSTPSPFDGWTEMRGEGDGGSVARLAARWLDARVLLAAGMDEEAMAEIARLREEAGRLPGGDELVLRLDDLLQRQSIPEGLGTQTDQALRALDPQAFEVGILLAAMRHAALGGDAELMVEVAEQLSEFESWMVDRLGSELVSAVLAPATSVRVDAAAVRRAVEESLRALGS